MATSRQITKADIAAQVRRVKVRFAALRHVAEDVVQDGMERFARQRSKLRTPKIVVVVELRGDKAAVVVTAWRVK